MERLPLRGDPGREAREVVARLYAVGAGGVLQAVRLALSGARLVLLEARSALQAVAVGAEGRRGWR